MDALIGSTGFVGRTLQRQQSFGAAYHSSDINEIEGRYFDRIVCAGVTALKWWANANPEADKEGIDRLIKHLDHVEADRFVLISTVDVYDQPIRVNEENVVPASGLHAYGLHRAMLEDWVRRRFANFHIIRLPALFGVGLRKNAIFDLLNDNRLEFIDPNSYFQWYSLNRLSEDISLVQDIGIRLVNFATEPITMETIRRRFFPKKRLGGQSTTVEYDVRTIYASSFGGHSGYIMASSEIMTALESFLADSQCG
jgi:hypothetical protein